MKFCDVFWWLLGNIQKGISSTFPLLETLGKCHQTCFLTLAPAREAHAASTFSYEELQGTGKVFQESRCSSSVQVNGYIILPDFCLWNCFSLNEPSGPALLCTFANLIIRTSNLTHVSQEGWLAFHHQLSQSDMVFGQWGQTLANPKGFCSRNGR